MSGTSLDGIDAALVAFDGHRPRLVDTYYKAFEPDFRERLKNFCFAESVELRTFGELDACFGQYLADSANALLTQSGIDSKSIAAIGSHGQTVYHHPHDPYPFTLQIGDPNRIAEITGITTVADFRRRDIAAGGQGAPLAPAFHDAVLRTETENRAVVNIGGIANVTLLPKDEGRPAIGFDSGPGNTFLDLWTKRQLARPMDENGKWAKSGTVCEDLLKALLADPYFGLPAPKSTGQEYFSANWLESRLARFRLDPADVQATLCQFTADSIAEAIRRHEPRTDRVLLCGGGVHNDFLVSRIARQLACPVESTAACGIDPDWVEAMAFAWLARQTLEGLAGNLPEVTGAAHPAVLGGIYPG
jgi:anhydro-N-acetylmuramic acid kinase